MLARFPCYTFGMTDNVRHSPPVSDHVGQSYTLNVRQVQALFDAAQLPRSVRSITRYCESQRLDGIKIDGPSGPEWKVSEASVRRATDELQRVHSVSDIAGHGEPEPGMTDLEKRASETSPHSDNDRRSPPVTDSVRQVGEGESALYLQQLEKRIEEKDEVIGMLRGELVHRNEEIVRRNKRERETNILIRGLQNLVLRLPPGSPPSADVLDGDAMTDKREVQDPVNP